MEELKSTASIKLIRYYLHKNNNIIKRTPQKSSKKKLKNFLHLGKKYSLPETPTIMSLIQIIIFIIILVLVQAGKTRISTTALTGMLNYVDHMFPRTSPNPAFYQSHYTGGGECNVFTAYERLVRESYQGRVSVETQIDIVYNSWGEPASNVDYEPCSSGFFLFILALASLMFCSKRRSLTFDEMVRLQYDPIFKYKYISGKF